MPDLFLDVVGDLSLLSKLLRLVKAFIVLYLLLILLIDLDSEVSKEICVN